MTGSWQRHFGGHQLAVKSLTVMAKPSAPHRFSSEWLTRSAMVRSLSIEDMFGRTRLLPSLVDLLVGEAKP
jgi:hypothetical protein